MPSFSSVVGARGLIRRCLSYAHRRMGFMMLQFDVIVSTCCDENWFRIQSSCSSNFLNQAFFNFQFFLFRKKWKLINVSLIFINISFILYELFQYQFCKFLIALCASNIEICL